MAELVDDEGIELLGFGQIYGESSVNFVRLGEESHNTNTYDEKYGRISNVKLWINFLNTSLSLWHVREER